MTAPSRGRGRPPLFDDDLREKYLLAVASGMRLQDAAAHVGLHRNHPTRLARTDSAFAAALEQARELGKKARDDSKPHDESRYNHDGCRCRTCCAAVAAGRRERRHAAMEEAAGKVVDLPTRPTPPILFAAEAS